MTIHNDIDKLFQKGLSDYAENPPGFVWDNIERKLNSKRLKRKHNIIYSIAASVALLLSFGAGYMFTDIKSNKIVAFNAKEVPPTTEIVSETKIEPASIKDNTDMEPQSKSVEAKQINTEKIAPIEVKEQNSEPAIENRVDAPSGKVKKASSSGTLLPPMFGNANNYNSSQNLVDEGFEGEKPLKNLDMKPLKSSKTNSNQTLNYDSRQLAVASEFTVPDAEEKIASSWSVGVSAAPLLSYRDVAGVSSENLESADVYSSYEQNYSNEKPLMSYSAGMNINYKVSRRWIIQSGLYFSEMGQVSENVSLEGQPVYSATAGSSYTINTSTGNVEVQGNQNDLINKLSNFSTDESDFVNELPKGDALYESSNSELETDFVQTYDFYEIPLVVNYIIIDKKLSMNVNGGLSANILYSNTAYVENDGTRYELDSESEDLKSMNYSGVFGLGLEYPIVTRLKINLNPTFRYAISSINTSGTVYPYSFGIYTGLRYNF